MLHTKIIAILHPINNSQNDPMKIKDASNRFLCKSILMIIFIVGTLRPGLGQTFRPSTLNVVDREPLLRLEFFDSINSVDWRKANNISACKITMHKFKKGEVNEKVLKYVTYKFHPAGFIQEMVYDQGRKSVKNVISEDNQIVESVIMNGIDTLVRKYLEYDEKGQLVRISQIGGDARFIEQITDYHYTDDGKVTEVMVHHTSKRYPEGDYEAYRESYQYDERGRIAEQQVCLRIVSGAIVADQVELKPKELTPAQCGYRTVNYYDEGDEPVKADYYHPDYMGAAGHIPVEGPRSYYTWERNDAGQVTEFQNISCETNKLESKKVTQYNAQGMIMTQEVHNSLGFVSRIVQGFNNDNQISVKMKYNDNNAILYMTTFRYDDKGAKTHIISHNIDTRKPEKAFVLEYQ